MQDLGRYRELVKKIISEFVELVNRQPATDEETFVVFDEANALVEEGVPNSDIVLAFQSPKLRQYTDFAAA